MKIAINLEDDRTLGMHICEIEVELSRLTSLPEAERFPHTRRLLRLALVGLQNTIRGKTAA